MRNSHATRLRRIVSFTAGAAALMTVSGVVGASFVKSPAEVAASTAAPPPAVITAPVVRKVLSEDIVIRGVFSIGKTLSFGPSSVADTEANAGGGSLVVTGMFVHAGQDVRSGKVIAEVSDRPVYVLQGPLPLWRDLAPGESGKDVMELQAALAGLGLSSGADPYGYFGSGTESAVKAFYASIGYPAAVTVSRSSAASPSTSPSTGTHAGGSKGGSTQSNYEAIVPMSEAWFVPALPATVLSVGAHVGAVSPSSVVTLAESRLRLTGQLDPSDSSVIHDGMKVSIYSQVTGYRGTGTVASIGRESNSSGRNSGGVYVPVTIHPSSKWPQSLNTQNVEITITARSSGKPVLAVPLAAVSSDASGQTEVVIEEHNGKEQRVPVETGMSADGYVELVGNTSVVAGMQVVVGQ
jgi:peptidoglycan hydrolase-like protein with peptidoglycan-binding domain